MENYALNVAELAKEKANIAFRAKDYATARSLYSHAMDMDKSNHLYPLNRSMANLKLARWGDAEADATKTLVLSPNNLKALFRRSIARRELGNQWDQAREDIQMFVDQGGDPTLGARELKAIADAECLPQPETSDTANNLDCALANLHIKDYSNLFTVRDSTVVQKGKGALASRKFQRGDLILSEKPIFSVPDAPEQYQHISIEKKVRNLSPDHLDRFLSLHNAHTECSCCLNQLLGIFGTNSFALNDDDSGICLMASRFNHSCSPNARYSFNASTGDFKIYALGTIAVGEEILVAYISSRRLYGNPRRSRQEFLEARYHYTCACSVCSLSEAESKMSDARRVKVNKLWEIIPTFSPKQGTQRLNVIVEAIHLLKEEGYLQDADDFTNDAGIVCAYHSDWVSAKYWAGLTYQTRVAEFGEDSVRAVEVRELYLNPKSFPLAGKGPPKKFTEIRLESKA